MSLVHDPAQVWQLDPKHAIPVWRSVKTLKFRAWAPRMHAPHCSVNRAVVNLAKTVWTRPTRLLPYFYIKGPRSPMAIGDFARRYHYREWLSFTLKTIPPWTFPRVAFEPDGIMRWVPLRADSADGPRRVFFGNGLACRFTARLYPRTSESARKCSCCSTSPPADQGFPSNAPVGVPTTIRPC
jgi:hypothetical protein